MGEMGAVMPLMNMGMQAAGGGKSGGGGGGSQGEGLTPQEIALLEYQRKQGQLRQRSNFAHSGTGASTMATQAAGGPVLQEALDAAKIGGANRDVVQGGLQDLAGQQGELAGKAAAASQGGGNQFPGSTGEATDATATG